MALKKLKLEREKEGFPITALREINTLLRLRHPNIIEVKEVVIGKSLDECAPVPTASPRLMRCCSSIYMVMEFMHHDLRAVMEANTDLQFVQSEVKCLLLQLLRALAFMHENYVMHRLVLCFDPFSRLY